MSAISEILSQYWWAVLIVIAIIVLLVSRKLGQTFGGGAVEIDVDRVVELLDQESVLLIDLAEQRTYQKGHIAGSVNMGVGQFCTNPGLILGVKSDTLTSFMETLGLTTLVLALISDILWK